MPERIMFCSDCTLYGTPAPFNDDTCGNCGSHNVTIFLPVRGLTPVAADALCDCYISVPAGNYPDLCAHCGKKARR